MEFNVCDKADDFKGKKRKEDLVDCVHQQEVWQSADRDEICAKLEMSLQNVLQPREAKEMASTYPQNRILVLYHHSWLNWVYSGGINV